MIYDILRNPLVKICGTIVIIYFALFTNTENPDSLGNRLSSERIKENYQAAKKKSNFIMTNVNAAKQHALNKKTENIDYDNKEIACGDTVYINYSIHQGELRLHKSNNAKFIIGTKNNWDIEQKIIGLKKGDETSLPIANPAKGETFKYKISIQKVTKTPRNIQIDCK